MITSNIVQFDIIPDYCNPHTLNDGGLVLNIIEAVFCNYILVLVLIFTDFSKFTRCAQFCTTLTSDLQQMSSNDVIRFHSCFVRCLPPLGASAQLVGTNNHPTQAKASFCEVFSGISGDGAHFVRFFSGFPGMGRIL